MPLEEDAVRDTGVQEEAERFRQLHRDGVLVLPNVWDAASARLVEQAGAAAIATTSGGVAWSLGWADGGRLPRNQALDALRRIAAAVDVPVTADVEDGYGETDDELRRTVDGVVEAGAVGLNIEDSRNGLLRPQAEQAARLAVVRAAADGSGMALFVNARIDTHLLGHGDAADRARVTADRAAAFVEAGADGIFVPGLLDPDALRGLAERLPVPLNAMAGPGAPTVAELAALGVRRVSVGTGIAQAAYATARRAAAELLGEGTYGALAGGLDYGELNAALA